MAKDQTERERGKKGEKCGKMPFSILFHKMKRQEEKLKEMKEYFQLEKMMKNHQSSIQGYFFRHFQFIRWKDEESMRGFAITYFNEFFTTRFGVIHL